MSRKNQKRKDQQAGEAGGSTQQRDNGAHRASPEAQNDRFSRWGETAEADQGGGNEPPSWRRFVSHYPTTTLVASFGVGMGLGVLAVAVFGATRRRETFWERPLHQIGDTLGQVPQMIKDRLPETSLWG
ncbi:MAG: hypothetical protein K2X91_04800 [Thermoleophilia bacterium]|nr:hypothetical protein [Thermoleophilia bacterium]